MVEIDACRMNSRVARGHPSRVRAERPLELRAEHQATNLLEPDPRPRRVACSRARPQTAETAPMPRARSSLQPHDLTGTLSSSQASHICRATSRSPRRRPPAAAAVMTDSTQQRIPAGPRLGGGGSATPTRLFVNSIRSRRCGGEAGHAGVDIGSISMASTRRAPGRSQPRRAAQRSGSRARAPLRR